MNEAVYILIGALLMLVFFVVGAIIVQIILEHKKKRYELESDNIQKARDRSNDIIDKALDQAREIVAQAQKQADTQERKYEHELVRIEKDYQEDIKKLQVASLDHLNSVNRQALLSFESFLEQGKINMSQHVQLNQRQIDAAFQGWAKQLEEAIVSSAKDQSVRIERAIETELKALKESVAAYEQTKKRLVDEYILDIVEETVKRTLGKAISIKDQADLVQQSLNEAKKEGFL